MGREIERKFLVKSNAWRGMASGTLYKQGYLCLGPTTAIRVRVEGETACLNIKQAVLDIARDEYEYAIPVQDAEEILARYCIGGIIDKTRYKISQDGLVWEVDEFHAQNAGLIVAEVELEDRDQQIDFPEWVGEEVSHDPRYLNANLCHCPYTSWQS